MRSAFMSLPHRSTRMIPDHVLVPLDGSPLADEALAHALALFDCRVTVLNVLTPLDAGMAESGVLESDEERMAAARERADGLVDAARERVGEPDREVDIVIETGDPAETILTVVDDAGIDQVVMGGHGGDLGEIARRLLGTVATAVVSESDVTVTVVR